MDIKYLHNNVMFRSAMLLLLGFVLGIQAREISAQEQQFSKRKDFYYDFENTGAKIEQVHINDKEVTLPEFPEPFQTAFLKVDIRTSCGGRLVQPHVILRSGNIERRQYFEFGSRGIRYINVSDFIANGTNAISFNFSHCRMKDKNVELVLFKNPDIKKQQVMVLAPHPDDAEIAAYGLYASNKNATVVNITIGDAGKKMYDELYADDSIHYIKKAEIRLWNSITVPMLAGIDPQNIINLGYFDASLKTMYSDTINPAKARYTGLVDINHYRQMNVSTLLDSVKGNSSWNSLVNDLKYLVSLKKPSVIVTPYPAIDVHADHKLTTVALIQALKELNYSDVEFWMYTNHFVYHEKYPTGKSRSLISLPSNTTDKNIYFNRICSFPLSETLQSDKVLALEAMNPLRPDTEWHTTKGSRKLYWKTWKENIRNTESDYYYRRAVRSNELFFVVDMNDLMDEAIYNQVVGELN